MQGAPGAISPIRERAAALVSATYRVTQLLPADEPLSKKIRETAVDILTNVLEFLSAGKKEDTAKDAMIKIEIMQKYLQVAGSLSGINPLNFAVLGREYGLLTDLFERHMRKEREDKVESRPQEKKETVTVMQPMYLRGEQGILSERQKTILARVNQVQQAKISDLSSLFSGISIKTIQRELQDLVAKNILRKYGEKRWTVYVRNNVS